MKRILYNILFVCSAALVLCCQRPVELKNDHLHINWSNDNGWKITAITLKDDSSQRSLEIPSGEYTLLYSKDKPDSTPTIFKAITGVVFPEPIYKYQIDHWKKSTSPVTLNTAGEAFHFYPEDIKSVENEISFTKELSVAVVTASWKFDPLYPTDILVKQSLIAKQDGYYSLATPSFATVEKDDLAWATIPGYFQGSDFQDNFVLAYAYGHGIPKLPVIYPDRTASTLSPIITTRKGISIAVTPAPGLARDPWEKDHNTHAQWKLGLSHMNRKGAVSPTLYYPVLGEPASKLKAGDTLAYEFRFSVTNGDWYKSLKHTVNDIYQFDNTLDLRENKQSLISRVAAMRHYLINGETSLWNIEAFEGRKIGGQSYLGGVVGSSGDAMKNSDYGAMWMLANASEDPILKRQVLPYALNFKFAQQQMTPGFFKGAAIGQYYLAKSKKFVEEWGEFVEPISLTYYTMLDDGNILLFEPQNTELRNRLRLGADLLLKWQKADGSWEVAYDRHTEQPIFKDIKDLRPTFYGLLVAYRILKDERYLNAARKGADWLIENGVKPGYFIGVCGDARYAPDFATGQTAQALLDLFDLTNDGKYKDAALEAARFYATSIYTHPVASTAAKQVKDIAREDWEITQSGLSFEHGGIMGSAQRHGPIQLASHAGLFVRVFQQTKDSLFLTMARSAAIGRDAFVDPKTQVASYYWNAMNKGSGPYPHHAWWQIGWITDYLLAEAELRSNGAIDFPRGFVTPKVGPHQSYGFEPGKIYTHDANLILRDGLVVTDNPNIEALTAISTDQKNLFVILMNDIGRGQDVRVSIDIQKLKPSLKIKDTQDVGTGKSITLSANTIFKLNAYGIQVLKINIE
ncbi:glycerophosphoryl diester phosphodiesterase [Ohtaekwangia koreensis]|uniref:glycerophosphoryl diester phosphodiesterase n=1 Tax=Ohtaekwangia koreensis TaxID=688867 RepID=UPI00117C3D37|nr:glycerophosphoryl diester phosphodiesterase [Ohtaekwangia koreensis]